MSTLSKIRRPALRIIAQHFKAEKIKRHVNCSGLWCGPLRNPSCNSRPSSGRKGAQTNKRDRLLWIMKYFHTFVCDALMHGGWGLAECLCLGQLKPYLLIIWYFNSPGQPQVESHRQHRSLLSVWSPKQNQAHLCTELHIAQQNKTLR